jgi:hypothetical protein
VPGLTAKLTVFTLQGTFRLSLRLSIGGRGSGRSSGGGVRGGGGSTATTSTLPTAESGQGPDLGSLTLRGLRSTFTPSPKPPTKKVLPRAGACARAATAAQCELECLPPDAHNHVVCEWERRPPTKKVQPKPPTCKEAAPARQCKLCCQPVDAHNVVVCHWKAPSGRVLPRSGFCAVPANAGKCKLSCLPVDACNVSTCQYKKAAVRPKSEDAVSPSPSPEEVPLEPDWYLSPIPLPPELHGMLP